jgi:hypothetical protein
MLELADLPIGGQHVARVLLRRGVGGGLVLPFLPFKARAQLAVVPL